MAQPPSPEDIARWDRWFAMGMNNRAWTLVESPRKMLASSWIHGQPADTLTLAHFLRILTR